MANYKDTSRDPNTGRRTEIRDADYEIRGNVEVSGSLTKNGEPVGGESSGVKRYVALLTQTGTDAPVATELENILGGTIVWARSSAGVYTGTLNAAFTANKSVLLLGSIDSAGLVQITRTSANVITLMTFIKGDDLPESWFAADQLLTETAIEIRVYP